MPRTRTMYVVALIALTVGIVAVRAAMGASVILAVVAQAPTIGPTNTAAAETAQAGVTAIAETDAPPTPTPRPVPTPIPTSPPVLPSAPAPRATTNGAPPAAGTAQTPAAPLSSGSVTARGTATIAPTTSSAGGNGAWLVIGIVAVVAMVGAVGWLLVRNARARTLIR